MKYTVVCVGKLKERFWKDACAEYTKRLGAYAKVDVREVADIDRLRRAAWMPRATRRGRRYLQPCRLERM